MSSNHQLQNNENAAVPTNSRAIAHSNIPALCSLSSQQRDTIAPLQKPTLPSKSRALKSECPDRITLQMC